MSRTTLRLAVAGAMSAVVLTGCQAGIVDEPSTTPVAEPVEQTQEPAQTQDAQDEVTEDDESADGPTEEATGDDAADDPADDPAAEPTDASSGDDGGDGGPGGGTASGEVPEPGTEVELGDTVTTHVQTPGEEGDEYFGYATLATTVTSAEPGDPDLFADAENAADFAGYTPWFVQVEHEWLTYEGEPNANMIPRLGALNEAGGELSPVINSTWSAGVPGCQIDMPEEKGVGQKATNCHVFAVPDGEKIGAVVWNGDDYADGGGSATDNPYWDDPVLWIVR